MSAMTILRQYMKIYEKDRLFLQPQQKTTLETYISTKCVFGPGFWEEKTALE